MPLLFWTLASSHLEHSASGFMRFSVNAIIGFGLAVFMVGMGSAWIAECIFLDIYVSNLDLPTSATKTRSEPNSLMVALVFLI